MHAFDRRTDRTDRIFSSLDRVCIPCRAVKMVRFLWPMLYNKKQFATLPEIGTST